MTDTAAAAASGPAGLSADLPGVPFYQRTRKHLKELLEQRRKLQIALEAQEESIFKKETEYLEETPQGNIITGFEAYTKAQAPGAARRKTAVNEGNRVFSRSGGAWGVSLDCHGEHIMHARVGYAVAS